MDDIVKINPKDIVCTFSVDGKEYCALIDSKQENDDNIYFALKTQVEGNNYVLTNISDKDMTKVLYAYEEKMNFLDDIDEFDEEGDDE